MTAAPLMRVEAPTDAQLSFVQTLCAERGYPRPPVYSKTDASWLIDAIRSGAYYPPEWAEDEGPRDDFDPPADSEDVPF